MASAERLAVFRKKRAEGLPIARARARGRIPGEPPDQGTPLYTQLAEEWAARGATVPGLPDLLWQRLASSEHLRRETESTMRQLRPAGEPRPVDGAAGSVQPEALT